MERHLRSLCIICSDRKSTTETTGLRVPRTWKFYFQSDLSLMFFSSLDSLWITACFSSKSFDLILFFRYKESNGTKKETYVNNLLYHKSGFQERDVKMGTTNKMLNFYFESIFNRTFSFDFLWNFHIANFKQIWHIDLFLMVSVIERVKVNEKVKKFLCTSCMWSFHWIFRNIPVWDIVVLLTFSEIQGCQK